MDAFEAVSLPETTSSSGKKYFSVAEANRALTLVRRIVEDVVGHYEQLCKLYATCQALEGQGDVPEAEQARRRYASVTDRLSELSEELEKIGCELKDFQMGLVDFPALHGDREVYLCWKLGETWVAHWHEVDGGFAGRQPLPTHVLPDQPIETR